MPLDAAWVWTMAGPQLPLAEAYRARQIRELLDSDLVRVVTE
jgi:hypothetical protein